MRLVARNGARLGGLTSVPGDKSISHRAVMFGAMARGVTQVENLLAGEDVLATVRAFRQLGASLEVEGTSCRIEGRAMDFIEPDIIDVGNSGTTIRLLLGILSGSGIFVALTGDGSIRRRPMRRVVEPLSLMGAHIHGRECASLAPLCICPAHLSGVKHTLPIASAQVKSALLLAGLSAVGQTVVSEPAASRDHTERMLGAFGAVCQKSDDGLTSSVTGGQTLKATRVNVPGDISSAAFLIAAALLAAPDSLKVLGVGCNPTRDGLFDVLQAMGTAEKSFWVEKRCSPDGVTDADGCNEPMGDIRAKQSEILSPVSISGSMIPRLIDELPVISVLCAFASGTSEIRDAGELRVKESDRIKTIADALSQGGVYVEELPDGLIIHGRGPGNAFRGGNYSSCSDHRLAMSLCVAALRADSPVIIDDGDCIMTSYPDFVETMNKLSVDGKPWLSWL